VEPQKVSDSVESPINKKILLLILGLALIFQTFVYTTPNSDEKEYLIALVSIVNPLVAAIISFIVARRYASSIVFGKAYAILGIGLLMMFLGEATWYTYVFVFELEPFPSAADVFFFVFYPFAMIHILLNVRFFQTKTSLNNKIWLASIPIVIITIYTFISLKEIEEPNFDFYYGMIFVIVSSVLLSLGLLGAVVFRGGTLGIAWILLLIGILLTTIGDVWFFYLELLGGYESGHPVELLWYASYWIITYALYKHRKII